MNENHFELEFFEDDHGRQPCRAFLLSLESPKRQALEQALLGFLAREGNNVCGTEWGKALGGGLSEFRVRHTEDEVMRLVRPDLVEALSERGNAIPPSEAKVLLRVFFHAYGDKVILLIGGYDKGRDPSARRQEREIRHARQLLRQFHQQQRPTGSNMGPRGVRAGDSFRTYWAGRRPDWRQRWKGR